MTLTLENTSRAQESNSTMEAETHTMGAEGFVPLWDVNTFGAPTSPQPLVKDSVVNIVGAAFVIGLFDPLKPLRPGRGNYVRTDDNKPRLIRADFGDERLMWSEFERLDHSSHERSQTDTVKCDWDLFKQLADLVAPWIALPRRMSEGLRFGPFVKEDLGSCQADHGKNNPHPRAPSQSPQDRFLTWYK